MGLGKGKTEASLPPATLSKIRRRQVLGQMEKVGLPNTTSITLIKNKVDAIQVKDLRSIYLAYNFSKNLLQNSWLTNVH